MKGTYGHLAVCALVASLIALVSAAQAGCDLPILHPGPTPTCGWYPVDCGHGRCCFEGDRCIVEPDSVTPACENTGEIGGARHRYKPGVTR